MADTYVFGKQSPEPIHCALLLHRDPFSRSYGVILPSSLARVNSNALVSSTHLPVSVCGTVTLKLPTRIFSSAWNHPSSAQLPSPSRLSLHEVRICLHLSLNAWTTTSSWPGLSFCVPPSVKHFRGGTGILTCCPSTTPFGLALGPTNPGRIYLPQETLGLRRPDFSSEFTLLMPA